MSLHHLRASTLMAGRGRWATGALLAGLLAAVALVAACGGSGDRYSTPPKASGTSAAGPLALKDQAGIGSVLVDSAGKTLYVNEQERDGKVQCTADCLGFWQPVLAPSGGAPAGPVAGISVVHRADTGQDQLAFDSAPLYTFTPDQPGEATGNNVKDAFGGKGFTWHAAAAMAAPAGAASTSTPASGGAYSY
jgi:predicted lipoprotein with Yx(FWY)xxD motif